MVMYTYADAYGDVHEPGRERWTARSSTAVSQIGCGGDRQTDNVMSLSCHVCEIIIITAPETWAGPLA